MQRGVGARMNGGDIAGDEDYHEYTEKFFARWAPVYNIMEILASGVRNGVSGMSAQPVTNRLTASAHQTPASLDRIMSTIPCDVLGSQARTSSNAA